MEMVKGFEDSINYWALMAVKVEVEQAARCNHMHSGFPRKARVLRKTKDDSVEMGKGNGTTFPQCSLPC